MTFKHQAIRWLNVMKKLNLRFIEAYTGTPAFGGVSKTHPKMMKPNPIRKPNKVMIFKRNVNKAVNPVAFILELFTLFLSPRRILQVCYIEK